MNLEILSDELLSAGKINKMMSIDGKTVFSFIRTMEKEDLHIPKFKRGNNTFYKPSDIANAAKANGRSIMPPIPKLTNSEVIALKSKEYTDHIEALETKRKSLLNEINHMKKEMNQMNDFKVDSVIPYDVFDCISLAELETIKDYSNGFIYVLISDERIIYVGQSKRIHARLEAHIKDDLRVFDTIYYAQVDVDKLEIVESIINQIAKPSCNGFLINECCKSSPISKRDIIKNLII